MGVVGLPIMQEKSSSKTQCSYRRFHQRSRCFLAWWTSRLLQTAPIDSILCDEAAMKGRKFCFWNFANFPKWLLLPLVVVLRCFACVLWEKGKDTNFYKRTIFRHQTCFPFKKIVFASTHNPGSDVVQNILLRHGWSHNNTVVLPPLDADAAIVEDFDIVASDHQLNGDRIKEAIPDSFFIAIFQDPTDTILSYFVKLGLHKVISIHDFAVANVKHSVKRGKASKYGKNQLLWDTGLKDVDGQEEDEVVLRHIANVERQFDLVMMSQYMEESIILLADLLCWPLEAVRFILPMNSSHPTPSNVDLVTRRLLQQWQWSDYLLYDHFAFRFDQRIYNYGAAKMTRDVARFRAMNQELLDQCVKLDEQKEDAEENLKNPFLCEEYFMHGSQFIRQIRQQSRRV